MQQVVISKHVFHNVFIGSIAIWFVLNIFYLLYRLFIGGSGYEVFDLIFVVMLQTTVLRIGVAIAIDLQRSCSEILLANTVHFYLNESKKKKKPFHWTNIFIT